MGFQLDDWHHGGLGIDRCRSSEFRGMSNDRPILLTIGPPLMEGVAFNQYQIFRKRSQLIR